MSSQLAYIGLGNMGRGMAKNIAEKGSLSKPLILYNRTSKKADDLAARLGSDKAKVVTDLKDAVIPSDIIFVCLGDDAAVRETIKSILQQDVKNKLIVDCSTVASETTNGIYDEVTKAGAQFVACPVFGAPPMAENGQLLCVLAGPKVDVDKVKPYTKGVMGRADIDYSDQAPGNATLLKVIGNTFIFQMVEALAEGHTLAEQAGLGNDNLHKFVEAMFPGPYVAYSNRMVSGDYYNREEPMFKARLALKDMNHALSLASSCGTKLNAVEVAKKHVEKSDSEYGTKADIAGIYGAVRMESGLKYENQ